MRITQSDTEVKAWTVCGDPHVASTELVIGQTRSGEDATRSDEDRRTAMGALDTSTR
jgi:hypothetical protein